MAGPCGIESREQAFAIAERVARAGAQFFRGGAYKPRTSPYSFQGMGEEGLKIMAEIRDRFGLLIVTEAVDYESLDLVDQYADMIQIGARNMQNFSLLKRAGRARKPVLLKRGIAATLEEFLMAAEYIMSEGNYNVVLCERGVRTFADHTRNTLDLSVVPAVQRLSHLPIIVDPSHGTGKRNKVTPLSRAAVPWAPMADHRSAQRSGPRTFRWHAVALSDQFDALMVQVRQIAAVLGRYSKAPTRVLAAIAGITVQEMTYEGKRDCSPALWDGHRAGFYVRRRRRSLSSCPADSRQRYASAQATARPDFRIRHVRQRKGRIFLV